MTGPKLNEGVGLLDGQVSTKATARYLRGSASKARAVLDLIRGLDVRRADEVLRFTQRAAAEDVRKVLASAVANAVHNESQDPEELFVLACYADEGPTLKRFRPRARGRASRLNKRTCHITVVVARMSDDRLEIVQARQASGPGARRAAITAQSRRERVARSRARAAGLREGADAEGEGADVEGAEAELADAVDVAEAEVVDEAEVADTELEAAPEDEVAEPADEASDSASPQTTSDVVVGDTEAEDAEAAAAEVPEGAVVAPEDGSVPEGYPIKGNTNSMKYHEPGGRYYDVTIAELFFDTAEHAEAAGYEAPAGNAKTGRGHSEAETEPGNTETD
jgi:large subunit ribosomal protein L22